MFKMIGRCTKNLGNKTYYYFLQPPGRMMELNGLIVLSATLNISWRTIYFLP